MTTTTKRAPLRAPHPDDSDIRILDDADVRDSGNEPVRGPEEAVMAEAPDERDQRFVDAVRRLRVGGTGLRLDERTLMIAGGVVAPLGLVIVLLGWWGAAHTPYVFEQLPYVISGGLLGVGLMFLGAFLYFAHWMTQMVREHRTQSAAVIEALGRLEARMAEQTAAPVVAFAPPANGTHPGVDQLVATERGTMAHRPDCAVVVGKTDLRSVTAADGLAPCKLCAPF